MDGSTRPNIVLIFMDDLGYGDLGCTGSPLISTPHIDRLAAEGLQMRQMYSTSPTCTPSRAGLLTGRYAQRVGLPRVIFPADPEGLCGWERTIAGVLSDVGYRCGIYGKWHLGARPEHNPLRHGFEEFYGLPYSNDMDPLNLYVNADRIEAAVDQSTLTRRYTDQAMDFISRHADEPFFVYLPHTMPHIPLHVEEDFRGTSRAGTYGDTVECLDHHVGRLVDHVEQLGLAERTLFLVTSDNGPWFEGRTGGLRGRKIDTYEGGIRMPFVARWTGTIQPGRVCDDVRSLLDVFPTLATLAGAQIPDDRPIDGVDMSGLLRGEELPPRPPLYFFSHWHLNAVRDGRWKVHVDRFPTNDLRELPQLFDVVADPEESYNLASLHPEVLDRMLGLVDAFGREIEAQREDAVARARS
ncbi:sulfatase [Georgenia alba]|uniref:Sulfatase n=1 Tax=Georgenia alba TaxID=2233858 RepID=A0ABW2QBR6_9MICO